MLIDVDPQSRQISAQFPDIWLGIYPKGHKIVDGRDSIYNGALLIRKGNEHVHLNAFDIADLLRFITDERVIEARKHLNEEQIAINLIRSVLLNKSMEESDDDL